MSEINERLREAACVGDFDLLSRLLAQGASVNDQNSMNGWTPLHWACKRNHISIVRHLLNQGADKNVRNKDGQEPAQLTSNEEICKLFGESPGTPVQSSLPIVPNYLANPAFPYGAESQQISRQYTPQENHRTQRPGEGEGDGLSLSSRRGREQPDELVLKVRLANSDEKDFIEVELDNANRTFSNLMDLICLELNVDKNLVSKIRKLPDTIVRKDKDVGRLRDFQELELVLTNKAMSAASRMYSLEPAKNHETILY